MHEILDRLPKDARVLDLGSKEGSFAAGAYPFLTVRVDLNRPKLSDESFVQADAVHLPFGSQTFDAVILNHCVEHFVSLKPALQEIGRVVKRDGAAYAAVPDASTVTDRIYRKVIRNAGGHVNLFDSAAALEDMLAWYLNLPHVATRSLYSSLIFLNRRNTRDPLVRGHMRFRGFPEPVLRLVYGCSRAFDRVMRARTGVYGWAFYFGSIGEQVDVKARRNVCIRCGQAHLPDSLIVRRGMLMRVYRCPDCGALNCFTRDL